MDNVSGGVVMRNFMGLTAAVVYTALIWAMVLICAWRIFQ